MGRDIHLHVEHQVDGVWKAIPAPRRLYPDWSESSLAEVDSGTSLCRYSWPVAAALDDFAKLAGLKYDHPMKIADARGLPPDVSMEVQRNAWSWGSDAHNCSWVTLEEAVGAELNREGWLPIFDLIETLAQGPVRLVFFFDN